MEDDELFDDEDETGPMVDDYFFVNSADRNYDGKFMQWERRIFRCDGRAVPDGSQIFELVRIVRDAADEVGVLSTRFALRAAADLRRFIDHLEHEVIAEARSEGWSWRDLGAATGLDHTSLFRRFAQYEVPIPRRR